MDISLKKLSEYLDLTPQRVDQLVKKGVVTKAARGKYPLLPAVQGYIKYLRSQIDEMQSGGEIRKKAEEKKAVIQAELLEIDLAVKRGDAVAIDDVLRVMAPLFKSMQQRLRGIPKHAARELGNKDIEQYLERYITDLLNELSNLPNSLKRLGPASAGDDPDARRTAPSAPKAKRKRVGRSVSRSVGGGKRRKR